MNGVVLASRLRVQYKRALPVIIMTGDIGNAELHDIDEHGCVQLNKPIKLTELTNAIKGLLIKPAAAVAATPHTVFIIDDAAAARSLLSRIFTVEGYRVKSFGDFKSFYRRRKAMQMPVYCSIHIFRVWMAFNCFKHFLLQTGIYPRS